MTRLRLVFRRHRLVRRCTLTVATTAAVAASVATRASVSVSTVCMLVALTLAWVTAFLWWEDWT